MRQSENKGGQIRPVRTDSMQSRGGRFSIGLARVACAPILTLATNLGDIENEESKLPQEVGRGNGMPSLAGVRKMKTLLAVDDPRFHRLLPDRPQTSRPRER